MSNDVIIRVRVRQDTRDGFAAVTKDAEVRGHEAGEKFTTRFGHVMARLAQIIQEPLRKAGREMGERLGQEGGQSFITRLSQHLNSAASRFQQMGQNIGQRIGRSASEEISAGVEDGLRRGADGRLGGGRDRVSGARSGGAGGRGGDGGRSSIDVDKQSLLSRFLSLGANAAGQFWEGFSGSVASFFSGDFISLILKGIAVAALGAAIAPVLGGAIVSAILLALGSGVIGLGVAAAIKDPRIKGAANDLKKQFSELFAEFGKPFRAPVADFLEKLSTYVLPMLKTYGPVLAEIFAPLTQKIGDGLIGFIQKLLPGLVDGIKGAAPIIEVLAKRLPDLGTMLGDFFREMGEHGPEAAEFFDDLLGGIIKLVGWIGKLIGAFLEFYIVVKNIFVNGKQLILDFASAAIDWLEKILDAAFVAFSWIPGLGGKLASAKAAFRDARENINAELGKIKDKTVTIRMRTFGLAAANAAVGVARTLSALGYASGGIAGMLPQSVGRAASGGIRNNLTLVGERGPELVDLAPGSRVHSNEDSRRMVSQGGGDEGEFVALARWVGSGNAMVDAIMSGIQLKITRQFGGSVQAGLGG